MKRTALILAALLFAQSATAGTAFLVRHYVSGMNRVCVYNYLGSDFVVTIRSYQVCPVTIEV